MSNEADNQWRQEHIRTGPLQMYPAMPPDYKKLWLREHRERVMREFCGWLSADIPELHGVEVPRLAESLDRFIAQLNATEDAKPL